RYSRLLVRSSSSNPKRGVKHDPVPRLGTIACSLVVLAVGCHVTLPDDEPYACVTDYDCGGGGYKCIDVPAKHCCLATGPEVCGNGLDDDCDGNADGKGRVEVCNGFDDNCDNRVDEGFNLVSDRMNCGACGNVCKASEVCSSSKCISLTED